jgi:hypothetical protein
VASRRDHHELTLRSRRPSPFLFRPKPYLLVTFKFSSQNFAISNQFLSLNFEMFRI